MKTICLSKPSEIGVGVVLKLCPDSLVQLGAKFIRDGMEAQGLVRTQGRHLFICVARNRTAGLWTPLFSKPRGPTIAYIPDRSRYGRHMWIKYPHYFDVTIICEAPHVAVTGSIRDEGTTIGQRDELAEDETYLMACEHFPTAMERFNARP